MTTCLTDRTAARTPARARALLERAPGRRERGFFAQLDAHFEERLALTALSSLEEGAWRRLTFGSVREGSQRLAAELRWRGHTPGEHMAILSGPSPEWGVAFLAILRAGGVAVPLDHKLEQGELASILEDARPGVLFVSPQELPRARELQARVASIWEIVVLEPELASRSTTSEPANERLTLDDRSPDEIALITYTSGTTGRPKGVMTTFGNLIHQTKSLGRVLPTHDQDRVLSILPLNHMFELVGGFLAILWTGGEVCYGNSHFPDDVMQALRDRRVTRMLCVPLFLELIKRRIEKKLGEESRLRRAAYRAAFHTLARIPHRALKRVLFRRIHAALGGSLRYFVSGGAPLEPRTERFFDRIGIQVYQGYGLTETSPVIAVNTCRQRRFGSVGLPLPGVEVRIQTRDDETSGEILTRGPHVMEGYRGDPGLTREAIDADGWFHTGDLGYVDADGFLHVTGRAKSLIVLGSGKKVLPEEVEACLCMSPAVAEVCIVGVTSTEGLTRDHERVCAVIVPAAGHSEENARAEVKRCARSLATYKRPSSLLLRAEPLPRTSTAKVRRNVVRDWAGRQLEVTS